MLFLASLDAAPLSLVRELLDAGRLPALHALMQAGTVLPAAPLPLVGVAYASEYGGLRPADHGIYFPFQWSAEVQRIRTWQGVGLADTIFRRVDRAGGRMVVLDPPECFPQHTRNGFVVSGWQFQERVLLAPWSTDPGLLHELRRRFGSAARTEESFGQPTVEGLLAIHRVLARAPHRLQQAAEYFLEHEPPDVLWITCAGLHLASHQFYDLAFPENFALAKEDRQRLATSLADILIAYDQVLGRILERLPAGTDTVAFFSKGVGPVVGWVDLLPEMLRRVLGTPGGSSPVAALRQWVPRAWRERVAGLLPDVLARELTARLWTPRANWRTTRAFTLPSDAPGFIRLNLRGRERDGCVAPDEASALCAEIAAGLATFNDLDGEPCVRKILRPQEILGEGKRLDVFPDLVVSWAHKPTLRGRGVRSSRFGEIFRHGEMGTGRGGDHAAGAMYVVAPGKATCQPPSRPVEPYDIPATILAALGLPHADLPGHPLLTKAG